MKKIKNLIVGAGPAGLAIAARLKRYNISFDIWEASDQVAHRWNHHYKRLHLHTVKASSHLPFIPFPSDYPTFASREQVLNYCRNYAAHFNILPEFGQRLCEVHPEGNDWLIRDQSGDTYIVENLIIATGLNNIPNWPAWYSNNTFKGTILHSRDYRAPELFKNKKCLIIGMGNTGAEIALDLAEHGVETSISVRGEINAVPLEAFGQPTQQTAAKLQVLPLWLQDVLGNLMKSVYIGDLSKYGLKTSKTSPLKQLRTTGKTPLIDLGTIKMIKKGKIKIKPDLHSLDETSVRFEDGSELEVDSIICATGYRSSISELVPEIKPYLDAYGNPKFTVGVGKWSGLYFLGFDNFRVGGILGIINQDSELIARHIKHYRTPLNQTL